MKLSWLSETLIGSEIVKLGNEINVRKSKGETIYNFTIGDFDPKIFSIPAEYEEAIITAYRNKFTNYPPADGIADLRTSVGKFLKKHLDLDFNNAEILIASGGRPLIYAAYRAVVDKGDKVIYAVPSWNNNHYTHFTEGEHTVIKTSADARFMPTAEQIAPLIKGASLLALCSPLNPTGTTFTYNELKAICDLVVAENESRGADEKKLYVIYDQMYWALTYGQIKHHNPIEVNPAMKPYTIFIDGVSKVFAATGVRVGWTCANETIIAKMKAILSHIGAWAPMAEQQATASFLNNQTAIDSYHAVYKTALQSRLEKFHKGIQTLKSKGYNVDSIAPEGALYLTFKLDLVGQKTTDGMLLETQENVTQFILGQAQLAIVPFSAFGDDKTSPWYRISVGTCQLADIDIVLENLDKVLGGLSK
jgi:aspartate aminotransferase